MLLLRLKTRNQLQDRTTAAAHVFCTEEYFTYYLGIYCIALVTGIISAISLQECAQSVLRAFSSRPEMSITNRVNEHEAERAPAGQRQTCA